MLLDLIRDLENSAIVSPPQSMVSDMAWMLAALFKKCFGKLGDSLPILSKAVRFGFAQLDLRFVRILASRPEVP